MVNTRPELTEPVLKTCIKDACIRCLTYFNFPSVYVNRDNGNLTSLKMGVHPGETTGLDSRYTSMCLGPIERIIRIIRVS